MRNVGVALAVTLVSGIQLSACSSAGAKVTTLEPSKTLAQLTTEERRQFCEDQFHYMTSRVSTDDARKIDCSVAASAAGSGAASGGSQAQNTCQKVYKDCIAAPGQQPQSSCDTFASKADGCMVTVDEASACTEAHADALEQLAKKADDTCKNLGKPATSAADDPSKTPQACVRVETLCPMLFATPGPATGMLHGWRNIWIW